MLIVVAATVGLAAPTAAAVPVATGSSPRQLSVVSAATTQPAPGVKARPSGHRSLPLKRGNVPARSRSATQAVTNPNGDKLDITATMISAGHPTDQYYRASDCTGPVAAYPGLIAPCGTVSVYDATYTGNTAPSSNTQTVQIWDACGAQVMNDYTWGWHNIFNGPRFGLITGTTSSNPLTVSSSSCFGTWTESYAFTQTFTDNQTLTITVTTSFVVTPDVPSTAQSAGQAYGGSAIHASQADPVDSLTGAFNYQPASGSDLSLAASGNPLAISRAYSSASPYSGSFGSGWSDNLGGQRVVVQPNGDVVFFSGTGSVQTFTTITAGFTSPPGVLAKLTSTGTGYTLTFMDQHRLTFDSAGNLSGSSDRNGQGPTYNYTAGILTSITNSGRTLTISHDPVTGHVSGVSASDGRSVSYGYDGSGRLATYTDATGAATHYTYDGGGRLSAVQDVNGHLPVRLTYDQVTGRVVTQQDPMGNTTTFGWTQTDQTNPSTGTATVTDARGGASTDQYLNGYLTDQNDAATNHTHYSWNINAQLTRVVDANGSATLFTYDAAGNMTTRAFAAASGTASTMPTESYTYNARNDVTSSTDFNGVTASYGYDTNGNLATLTRPNIVTGTGTVTAATNVYNSNGTLKSSTDANGGVTNDSYNSAGDLIAAASPMGRTTTFGRDNAGRMTWLVDPRGNVTGANPATYKTTFAYDNADRLTVTTDPLGHSTTTHMDAVGNPQTVTDPLGRTTTLTYDNEDRILTVQGADPAVPPATISYDADGNVATKTTPGGVTTTNNYDAANHLTKVITPAGTWTYARDAMGRQSSAVPPSANAVATGYTAAGLPAGVTPANFLYDANGNRTVALRSGMYGYSQISTTYNALNLPTAVTYNGQQRGDPNRTFTYTYDNMGRMTGRTYPGATPQTLAYDGDGRLKSVTSGSTTLASYVYNDTTGAVTANMPGGVATSTTIDAAGRPASVISTKGSTVLSKSVYTLDAVGNPTQILNTDGTTDSFTYDAPNRLTKVCYATTNCAGATNYASYAYGPDGQRTQQTTQSGTTTYSYDTAGRLISRSGADGAATLTYDADGNLLGDGTSTYAWNALGDLTSTTTAGATTTYGYDILNHRNSITKGQATTTVLTDPVTGQLAEEVGSNGSVIRQYTYGLAPVGFISGSSTYSYLSDAQGAIRALTDANGTVQQSYRYSPYGQVLTTTAGKQAPTNPTTYQHDYADATNTYRIGSREYRSDLGVFLSPDPAQQGGALGTGYGYARSNPMSKVDPSGNRSVDWTINEGGMLSGANPIGPPMGIGCTATVSCAATTNGRSPLALRAGTVAGSGSTVACTSAKGGCPASVISQSGTQSGATSPGSDSFCSIIVSSSNGSSCATRDFASSVACNPDYHVTGFSGADCHKENSVLMTFRVLGGCLKGGAVGGAAGAIISIPTIIGEPAGFVIGATYGCGFGAISEATLDYNLIDDYQGVLP